MRAHFKTGVRSLLFQLSTGGGKTAVAAFMAQSAAARGLSTLFVCHRTELSTQTSEAFSESGLDHGLVVAGHGVDASKHVQVAMVGALRGRMDSLRPPDLVIWDECHHIAAASWRALFERMPGAKHVGLSATPMRLSGEGLGDFFEVMVCGPSCAELIASGHLSKYRLFGTPQALDTSKLHMIGGDFNRREVIEMIDRPKIVGDAVDHYLKHGIGRSALLFDVSVASSERQAEAFKAAGIAAMHVDAGTADIDRKRAIKDLASGELRVLTNVDLFGEGVSVNNVSCIIQKRPTASLSLHLQQIGRGLRMFPGKTDCLILDQVGNWSRHGLPDEERTWSLDGKSKRKKGEISDTIKQCEKCYAAFSPLLRSCPECGHTPKVVPRETQQVAGELVEVTARVEAKQQQGRASSLAELMALGHSRRRAEHILVARAQKEMLRNQLRSMLPTFSPMAIQRMKPAELKAMIAEIESL
jgi:superfamily II DNA or RNA helicase